MTRQHWRAAESVGTISCGRLTEPNSADSHRIEKSEAVATANTTGGCR